MPVISARQPGTLPAIAILRKRCEALARLDRALDPDEDVPTHDFDRRAGIFWLRDAEGNHVQISFRKAGVVILGFDHDSPMSPAHNDEAIWPGVIDELPSALRRALADYSLEHDITFCIWREARARQWRSGRVRRPRGRDVDGSAGLLAILDGNPRGYRAYARTVFERDVPLATIARAYAGHDIELADAEPAAAPVKPTGAARPKFAVGTQVIDPWDRRGKIAGYVVGLDNAPSIGDPGRWLRGLSIKPKTPRRGIWYHVNPRGGGQVLIGERDLRRA